MYFPRATTVYLLGKTKKKPKKKKKNKKAHTLKKPCEWAFRINHNRATKLCARTSIKEKKTRTKGT